MYDDERETPPLVVGAVAAGVAALPFIGVYAIMFLVHGSIHPVNPPDVTRTKGGEFAAGWVALAVFVLASVALLIFLNGSRRWPFVLVQVAVLGTAIWFFVDETKGGRAISFFIMLTSFAAIVLACAPQGWDHVRRTPPRLVARAYRRPVPPSTPIPVVVPAVPEDVPATGG